MKWKNLQMPRKIETEDGSTSDYAKFIVEPLERGFGTTIGNSLRRVLLSSLQGSAVSSIKIDGVLHEFSTVPSVFEDVAEIVLNVKGLTVVSHADGPKMVTIDVEGPATVTGADIQSDADVEVLNKTHHIATVDKGGRLRMDLEITSGRGYVTAEAQAADKVIGTIPVDAHYCPVKRVTYNVQDTRVGQKTDYDKLVLEVWTNGSVTPEDGIAYAAKILKDHLLLFINFEETQMIEERAEVDEGREELRELLTRSVDELELSVRSSNCLNTANIKTIGDLVRRSEGEMLKYRNFGRKSLKEISDILRGMNLHFGMDVEGIVDAAGAAAPEGDKDAEADELSKLASS
ncbi:MAG: DNA-directed RNA polymerase subunit alpha [bacterium]